ncbi:MAG: DUF4340 domain-containing protein [bacterium]
MSRLSKILVTIFLILSVYIGIENSQQWFAKQQLLNPISQIKKKNIDAIIISDPKQFQELQLIKKTDGWYSDGIPVDPLKLDYLFTVLKILEKRSLIATRKENYHKFGLDIKQATEIRYMQEGKVKFRFKIGQRAQRLNSCYILFPDEKVYLLDTALSEYITTDKTYYWDLNIQRLNKHEIKEIHINAIKNKKKIFLTKNNTWITKDGIASSHKYTHSLDKLLMLKASGIKHKNKKSFRRYHLFPPQRMIEIYLKSGHHIILVVGAKENDQYKVLDLSKETYIYDLPSGDIETLFR